MSKNVAFDLRYFRPQYIFKINFVLHRRFYNRKTNYWNRPGLFLGSEISMGDLAGGKSYVKINAKPHSSES